MSVHSDEKLLAPQAVLQDGYGQNGRGSVQGRFEVTQVQPLLEVGFQLSQPLSRPHVNRMNQNSLQADLVAEKLTIGTS